MSPRPASDEPIQRAVHVTAIDHVVLRTTQLQAQLRFYTEVLCCPLEKVQADIGLYQLRAGDALIDLLEVENAADGANGNMDHFCLQIASFDAAALQTHLAAHGVATGGVETRYGAQGNGPSLYLHDPDGNLVELKASG
ncbi:MAG TPA: VOC family protein [Nevskiaceae bacterium]